VSHHRQKRMGELAVVGEAQQQQRMVRDCRVGRSTEAEVGEAQDCRADQITAEERKVV